MSILQLWLVVGVPALIAAAALFMGQSRVRTAVGYAVLAAAFAFMVTVDPASGAAVGALAALLYAAGRGGQAESQREDTSTIAVPESVRRPSRHRAG